MTRRRGEAGDGKLGCILWTLLLAIVVLGAWKWVPAKVKSAELHDFMVEQAKWAGSEKAETLRGRIVAKAAELELPVDPKSVSVVHTGSKIKMRCVYTVPLEFPGYTYNWLIEDEVSREIFYW